MIITIIAGLIFAVPVFFLNNFVLTAIFSIVGLSVLFHMWRITKTRKSFIFSSIVFYLAHIIRFSTIFGTEISYMLLSFLAFIFYTFIFVGSMLLERIMIKTKNTFFAVLITPVIYTLITLLLSVINFGYITNVMAYFMCINYYSLSLRYITEYGITFLFMLVSSFVSYVFIANSKKTKCCFAVAPTLLTIIPLIIGSIISNNYPNYDYELIVACSTSQEMSYTGEEGIFYDNDTQLEKFELCLQNATQNNADMLVLNEEYFYYDVAYHDYMKRNISSLIATYRIPTVVCMEIENYEQEKSLNQLIFFDESGNSILTYNKHSLVPFVEAPYFVSGDDKPGYVNIFIGGHDINISAVICFDINSEAFLKRMNKDTELLVVPSWDWDNCNFEQVKTYARSAMLNTTILKSTFEGFTYVSTPKGELIASISTRKQYELTTIVKVPIWEKN